MIFTFGDSWTAKWQGYKPWPALLDKPSKNFAAAGSSNKQILDQVSETSLDYPDEKVDGVVVAFTSIARLTINMSMNMELCIALHPDYPWYESVQKKVFEEAGLRNLLHQSFYTFHAIESIVNQTWGCKTYFIPVFEDCKFWREKKNFLPHSLINLMHNKEKGRYFMYDCPVYEFGYMQDANKNGQEWLDKYIDKDWRKAHFERSDYTMTSELFDNTQHPNQQGHRVLAEYFDSILN